MGKLKLILPQILMALAVVLGGCSGGQPVSYVPDEIFQTAQNSGYSLNLTPENLNEQYQGNEWINQVLFGGAARTDPRLPNYSYLQGLLQAEEHIIVSGQVRIVGGVVGADTGVVALYAGAMLTANPYAYTGAENALTGGPNGIKTRIGRWREIPSQ